MGVLAELTRCALDALCAAWTGLVVVVVFVAAARTAVSEHAGRAAVRVTSVCGTARATRALVLDHGHLVHVLAARDLRLGSRWQQSLQFLSIHNTRQQFNSTY